MEQTRRSQGDLRFSSVWLTYTRLVAVINENGLTMSNSFWQSISRTKPIMTSPKLSDLDESQRVEQAKGAIVLLFNLSLPIH